MKLWEKNAPFSHKEKVKVIRIEKLISARACLEWRYYVCSLIVSGEKNMPLARMKSVRAHL